MFASYHLKITKTRTVSKNLEIVDQLIDWNSKGQRLAFIDNLYILHT